MDRIALRATWGDPAGGGSRLCGWRSPVEVACAVVVDTVASAEEHTMNANPSGLHTVLALTFANVAIAVVLAVATVPSARV